MKTVLFIFVDRKDGEERTRVLSIPLKNYKPIALFPYREGDNDSIPISGHAVAIDGEELRGIFCATIVYPGSGHIILPELGSKKIFGALDDTVCGYRVCIVPELNLQKKIPFEEIPRMYPCSTTTFYSRL